jgi:hypothetical protein
MFARKFYLIDREEVLGPLTPEEVRRLLASGEIRPDALGAERGSAKWKPIGELLDEREAVLGS